MLRDRALNASHHILGNPATLQINTRSRYSSPEKLRERLVIIQRKYNLDFDKLEEVIRQQGGLCLLCFRPLGEDIYIDHEHREENAPIHVRGVLHNFCNVTLGKIETRGEQFLRNVLEYLGWDL
jgi:hypothetical protein